MSNWTYGQLKRHKARVIELIVTLLAALWMAPASAGALDRAVMGERLLELHFDGPVGATQVVALDGPRRIAIDIADATPGSIQFAPTPVVSAIRQGRVAGGALRVVLDLAQPVTITDLDRSADGQGLVMTLMSASPDQFAEAVRAGRRLLASIGNAATPTLALAWRPARRYQVSVPIGPPTEGVALPRIAGPSNNALPLVVIDAGHGGHDPGAIAPDSGRREKDVTLAIARTIRDALLASGRVRVALTRDSDEFLVLEERYGIARRLHADLFLSIHADSAENRTASGASIYTLSEVASDREASRLAARENRANILNGVDLGGQNNDVRSILIDLTQRETMNLSSDFARTLQRAGGADIPFRTASHRFAGFVVLKAPDMPSVLLETGFISNPADADRIASVAGQRAIARAVRDAVLTHFARRSPDARTVAGSNVGMVRAAR